VVVLETGGPVLLPWLERVAGAVEAWYPGSQGGPAIARVLSGAVNPSGHLPASFPRALEQLPRPEIVGRDLPSGQPFDLSYDEGAAVGYRWYDKQGLEPRLAFGHGLTYTRFSADELSARVVGGELEVTCRVANTGKRSGKHVTQIYVAPRAGGWEAPKRLAAFGKVELAPGATAQQRLRVDPRLLAVYDTAHHAWHVSAGDYDVLLANSARDTIASVKVRLPERWLPAGAGVGKPR
jgi:beta-glucosidase